MSLSTSSANRSGVRKGLNSAKKSPVQNPRGSARSIRSEDSVSLNSQSSGKLSARRVPGTPNRSSGKDDLSSSNFSGQNSAKITKNTPKTTPKAAPKTMQSSGQSSNKPVLSSANSSSKNLDMNARKSSRRVRDEDSNPGDSANVSSASKSQKKQISDFETPSGDISSVNKPKSTSTPRNAPLSSRTPARTPGKTPIALSTGLGPSLTPSKQPVKVTPKTETFKADPASTARHIKLEHDLSSSSTSESGQKPPQKSNPSSRRSSNASNASKSTAASKASKKDSDDSSKVRVSFTEEETSPEQTQERQLQEQQNIDNEGDTTSRPSSVSSRSSSIGVLLLSRTQDSAEGLMTLHSRSNSPQRSPVPMSQGRLSPLPSPIPKAFGQASGSLQLSLPDKAKIDQKNDEDSAPIPRFASDESSSMKESDADSSIKPPDRDDNYSDSISPLSSSTDPSYSYLDELPKQDGKLNISKLCNDREIYIPDSTTLESGFLFEGDDGHEWQDTDDEPEVVHLDQTKKEIMAEIEKPSNSIPQSAVCLLI